MKSKLNYVQVSTQVEKDIRDRYQRLYPYTLASFIYKAIYLAIKDKNFFTKVFFSEV